MTTHFDERPVLEEYEARRRSEQAAETRRRFDVRIPPRDPWPNGFHYAAMMGWFPAALFVLWVLDRLLR